MKKAAGGPAVSEADLRLALRDTVARLGKPSSPAELRRALPKPYQAPIAELTRMLGELAREGALFAVKDGKSFRYADRDPATVLAEAVRAALGEGPLSKKDLESRIKRAVPGFEKLLPAALAAETARGAVREHPKVGKHPLRYGLEPPDATPFLAKAVKEAMAVAKKLAPHGVDVTAIHAALGRALGVTPAIAVDDEGVVRGALADLAAREPPGALLSVRNVRARAGLDKARFDRAVLALSAAGYVELHHHDFPASLPEDERLLLVRDPHGVHYVGIALLDRRAGDRS